MGSSSPEQPSKHHTPLLKSWRHSIHRLPFSSGGSKSWASASGPTSGSSSTSPGDSPNPSASGSGGNTSNTSSPPKTPPNMKHHPAFSSSTFPPGGSAGTASSAPVETAKGMSHGSQQAGSPMRKGWKSSSLPAYSEQQTQDVRGGNDNTERNWIMGAEAFNHVMPHHASITALWETKWKFPCTKSLYPFHDGAYEDFEPVFQDLIQGETELRNGSDAGTGGLYNIDPDLPRYTAAFFNKASELEKRGDEVLRKWKEEERRQIKGSSAGVNGGSGSSGHAQVQDDVKMRGLAGQLHGDEETKKDKERADQSAASGEQQREAEPGHVPPASMLKGLKEEEVKTLVPQAAKGKENKKTAKEEASDLYLRAAALLRIARFPYIVGEAGKPVREKEMQVMREKHPQHESRELVNFRAGQETKWKAWVWQKNVYMKAGKLWEEPCVEVMVPHSCRKEGEGEFVPIYVRVPSSVGSAEGVKEDVKEMEENVVKKQERDVKKDEAPEEKVPQYEEQEPQQQQQQQQRDQPSVITTTTDGDAIPIVELEGTPATPTAAATATDTTPNATTKKIPAVLLLTGLDGYRPDNTVRCNEFLSRGWAAVVAEIPGTADCPADPSDPVSGDRVWDSILTWMEADGRFDMNRLLCWGLSAGGYHATRLAHTHKDRGFVGVVAQGAGSHYFFDKEWIDRAEGHEYPFALAPAMARKHGFASIKDYRDKVQKRFSLLERGILERPSTRLLLVNGMQDGLMPIEDSFLLFEHGTPKEARFFSGALHMGYPKANEAVYPWMEQVMGSSYAK